MKHRPNRTKQPVTDRVASAFLSSVDRSGECWIWRGKADKEGYGILYKDGGDFRAHRVAYELAFDASPGDLQVCHRCDNPQCVRPDHLFLGTIAENTADRNAKSRQAKGARCGMAKLDDDTVRRIRAELATGARQVDLAERFGVSQASISLIGLGATWRHVA